MFRSIWSFSAVVVTLLWVTGHPDRVHAQMARSHLPSAAVPSMTVPQMTFPRSGRFGFDFDRRFVDPRFGTVRPGFDPLFLNSGFTPTFNPLFLNPTVSPGFDPFLRDPRFDGFRPSIDQRFLDPRFRGF
jgi:hypothetical protein